MIILRKGQNKDNFWYEHADGTKIKDKKILEYIDKLRIPPAYQNVEIFYIKSPKILFQGFDNLGRLQQIYSESHKIKAYKKRYKTLIEFGKQLPNIYKDVENYMKSAKITKNKIIAIIIRIISHCEFRIGNIKYVNLYGHYGISTIRCSHLRFDKKGVHISFVGKKGVINECYIEDNQLINALKTLIKNKNKTDFLFTYEKDKEETLISAIDINNWLGTYGKDITTKFFRNYDANILLIKALRVEHDSITPQSYKITQRKKILSNLMQEVSKEINNTPAICRKSYISQELLDLYLNHPISFKKYFLGKNTADNAFIKFLEDIHA